MLFEVTAKFFRFNKTIIILCLFIVFGTIIIRDLPNVLTLTQAPDFTVTDIEGTSFSLSDFFGRVVLLEFIQTKSNKCIEQVPYLIAVQNEFGDDLIIISLSIDSNDTSTVLQQFRDEYGTNWRYAQSTPDIHEQQYNVSSTPTIYVIDQDRYIRHHYADVVEDKVLREDIRQLFVVTVTLNTSPTLERVHFQVDGQDYYTAVNGSIRVDLTMGEHNVTLVNTQILRGGFEYRFLSWNGNASGSINPLLLNITSLSPTFGVQATFIMLDQAPPIADAGPDQRVGVNQAVILNGSNSTDNLGIRTYTWTFQETTTEALTGVMVTYVFTKPGEYLVTLNVTDLTGYWAVDTVVILVLDHSFPIARAGNDQIVPEDTFIVFNGSTSSDNIGIVEYVWTFWDEGLHRLSGMVTTYSFRTPNTYLITLTVTDAAGNSASDSLVITVIDITPPVADAGLNQTVNEDLPIILKGDASWDEHGITSYTWTFIDYIPHSLEGINVTWTFLDPGEYAITLRVTDTSGNTASDRITIKVHDVTSPIADAGNNQVVEVGIPVNFSAVRSKDNVKVIRYEWEYGDGGQGTGITSTHSYNQPGEYTVTLTVYDPSINHSSEQITVIVVARHAWVLNPEWVPPLIVIAIVNVLAIAGWVKETSFRVQRS